MDNDSTQIISVEADIIALDESIHFKFPNNRADEYFIVITLTNTQDTTVPIRIMSCSWTQSFTFNDDSLSLCYPGCDSNFPITIEISAHKTVTFYSKLKCGKKKTNYANPISFRIGFIDLPYEGATDEAYPKEEKKKYNTYWSNIIYLHGMLYEYKETGVRKNF